MTFHVDDDDKILTLLNVERPVEPFNDDNTFA